jgi:23S rRNA (adenine2503-C2)-methyltransferase
MKEPFLGRTLKEIEAWTRQNDFQPDTAWKITRWFYPRGVADFTAMKDISKAVRNKLAQDFETGISAYTLRKVSADGSVKYSFQTEEGNPFEAVYLPEGKRHTLCLSIQSGCRMGCKFCRTARLGFNGNLQLHQILSQLCAVEERKLINHIVFMGMGEPMDNYANLSKAIEVLTAEWGFAIAFRYITVSTVGVQPGLNDFLVNSRCNLALSLHSPYEEERKSLIPMEKVYPFRDLLAEMKDYKPARKRRISVQYTLIGGVNDSEGHLRELVNLLRDSHLKLNLISFHPFTGCDFIAPADERIRAFMKAMNEAGIYSTVRKSRGEDIGAACGMLGK